MPRGPLPSADARRRNAPTITATRLPRAGRKGRAPKCPYDLGDAGATWWAWAWKTPQATKWDAGSLYHVARRARLEDELATLETVDELAIEDLLGDANPEAIDRVKFALRMLKSSAGGSTSVMKEMRELDNRLGLNAKAMAELRWIVADPEEKAPAKPEAAEQGSRLRAV